MVVAARSITAAAARRLGASAQIVETKNNAATSVLARAVAAGYCSTFTTSTCDASIIPKNVPFNNRNKMRVVETSTLKSYFSSSTKLKDSSSSEGEMSPPPTSTATRNNIIPTKHSRAQTPPIAPYSSLSKLTTHLLSSTPGTLFSYNQSDLAKDLSLEQERELAIERADVTAQTFEYVLRGHSALLPGSIVDRIPVEKRSDVPDEASKEYQSWVEAREGNEMSAVERVAVMNQLLERMEEEGRVYVELRSRFRSQVATIARRQEVQQGQGEDEWSDSDSDSASSSSDDSSDSDNEETEKDTIGAPPGPTITMYDLVLDALSVASTPTTPSVAKSILRRIVTRHELDGGYGNTNPLTIPTALSYNAVIRACANIPNFDITDESPKNQYVRDAAMDASFTTFDAMLRSDVVNRNSATFDYLIRVTSKFIPHSLTRSNIIFALYDKVLEERVYSEQVRQALIDANMEKDGKEFGKWVQRDVVEKDVLDTEHKHRMNSTKRRYVANDHTY